MNKSQSAFSRIVAMLLLLLAPTGAWAVYGTTDLNTVQLFNDDNTPVATTTLPLLDTSGNVVGELQVKDDGTVCFFQDENDEDAAPGCFLVSKDGEYYIKFPDGTALPVTITGGIPKLKWWNTLSPGGKAATTAIPIIFLIVANDDDDDGSATTGGAPTSQTSSTPSTETEESSTPAPPVDYVAQVALICSGYNGQNRLQVALMLQPQNFNAAMINGGSVDVRFTGPGTNAVRSGNVSNMRANIYTGISSFGMYNWGITGMWSVNGTPVIPVGETGGQITASDIPRVCF